MDDLGLARWSDHKLLRSIRRRKWALLVWRHGFVDVLYGDTVIATDTYPVGGNWRPNARAAIRYAREDVRRRALKMIVPAEQGPAG